MNHNLSRKVVACILIVLTVMYPMYVFAEENDNEQKTVRVGYVNVVAYEEGGEGEYKRGSGYEYLQKISYYTGWKYEYVYGSFNECYEMLVNGDIDLFGNFLTGLDQFLIEEVLFGGAGGKIKPHFSTAHH